MKRFFVWMMVMMIVATTPLWGDTAAAAEKPVKPITVRVDTLPVAFDVEPIIQNGRTVVPFRAIAEALNVEVSWEAETPDGSGCEGGHRRSPANWKPDGLSQSGGDIAGCSAGHYRREDNDSVALF